MIGHEVEERAISEEEPAVEDAPREEQDGAEAPPGTRGGEIRGVLELAVLLLAVLLLAWGVVSWVRATGHDDADVARAELRDQVLITARSEIETLNTLDANDIAGGLKKWEAVSTGTFKDQIVATTEETIGLLADQRKISTGKVVDAAVLDLKDDSATVIAAVETSVADADDPAVKPTVKRDRFTADLAKVDGKWLIEALAQVPVNIS